ncbi:MAG: ROK family protein [Herbinix sp.]|nr:ROK family protein [Herbinix sp.]
MKIGALEAGGTKMVCAVGSMKGEIYDQISIPTEKPEVTIPKIIQYFKTHEIDCLGVGCFGPIDLNKKSDTYGFIKNTPKTEWINYNIIGNFKEALNVPVGFDTDVNGSVLGEVTFGCAQNLDCVVYITVGTGIGVGAYINGRTLQGMMHPEAGHVLIKKNIEDDYEGICPYHKSCLEGLASGSAIEKRWGRKGTELEGNSEVWELEASYLAQAIINYIYTYSPQKVILGGGIMHQKQLFPLIRKKVLELNKDYLTCNELLDINTYIVPPSLGDNQGIMGALELGRKAYIHCKESSY